MVSTLPPSGRPRRDNGHRGGRGELSEGPLPRITGAGTTQTKVNAGDDRGEPGGGGGGEERRNEGTRNAVGAATGQKDGGRPDSG